MAANNTNIIHARQGDYFTLCRQRDWNYGHQAMYWAEFRLLPTERPKGDYSDVQCARCAKKLAKLDSDKAKYIKARAHTTGVKL